jgi:hypothetical protein
MGMPNPLHLLLLPLLVLLVIPLFALALLTIATSITVLVLRVVLVYVDLGIALIRVHFFPSIWSPFHPLIKREPRTKGSPTPRSTTSSTAGRRKSGPQTPKVEPINPLLGSQIPDRGFEGIGGWRDVNPDDPEDEHTWLNMNSRLDLSSPSTSQSGRRHRRALTSGALSLTIPPTRGIMKSPGHTPVQLGPSTRMTPVTAPAFNFTSPEDYFIPSSGDRAQGSGETSNIGRVRRTSGSSGSVRDLHMTRSESDHDGVE